MFDHNFVNTETSLRNHGIHKFYLGQNRLFGNGHPHWMKNKVVCFFFFYPIIYYGKARMGLGFLIKIKSVTIKTPCQERVIHEPSGVCHVFKFYTHFLKRRIGSPKTISPPKVREPGINPHARTRTHQKGITRFNNRRCMGLFFLELLHVKLKLI